MSAQAFCTACGTARVADGSFCGTCGAAFALPLPLTAIIPTTGKLHADPNPLSPEIAADQRRVLRNWMYFGSIAVYWFLSILTLKLKPLLLSSVLLVSSDPPAAPVPTQLNWSLVTSLILSLSVVVWSSLIGTLGGENRRLVWQAVAIASIVKRILWDEVAFIVYNPTQYHHDFTKTATTYGSDVFAILQVIFLGITLPPLLYGAYWSARWIGTKTLRAFVPASWFKVSDARGWRLSLWWAWPIVVDASEIFLP